VLKTVLYNAPAPYEYALWLMARQFGWTLEYIENLPVQRLLELSTINDAENAAKKMSKSSVVRKTRK
jgi:hypothetical protein